MPKIVIRKATNKDVMPIMDLIFDIWVNEYSFTVSREDTPDLSHIETHYAKKDGIFLIALDSSNIVGTIACSKLSKKEWILKRMFVKKSHRLRGIAQALLNRLLDELSKITNNNNVSLFLSTKEGEASSAKAFYLKNGFKVIPKSILPENFPYFYKDDLFMMKSNLQVIYE